MNGELDPDADGDDEDDGGHGAQFDASQSHEAEELHEHHGQHGRHDDGGPRVHQRHCQHHKDAAQHTHERQHQVEAQVDVLLPEGERDAARVVGQARLFKGVADLTDLLHGLRDVLGRRHVVQVEGDLAEGDRLGLGDWKDISMASLRWSSTCQ